MGIIVSYSKLSVLQFMYEAYDIPKMSSEHS